MTTPGRPAGHQPTGHLPTGHLPEADEEVEDLSILGARATMAETSGITATMTEQAS